MKVRNGVLPVDKPVGPTSHDIVARARRSLGIRRIGHTGTLDPFASGLLLLCLGPSTRLAEYLRALPKRYTATVRLGVVTETDDRDGAVVSQTDSWTGVTRDQLQGALATQRGAISQVPPRYSAKRIAGKRMYELARAGEDVKLEPSDVHVARLELLRFDPPEFEIEVECSSGTYIRSIGRDVGEQLGVGAHLTALRRTGIGDHDVARAIPLEVLDDEDLVERSLIPPARAVQNMPRLTLPAAELRSVVHGGSVPAPADAPADRPLALVSSGGDLIAIGERVGDRVQPRKVFA